MVVENTPSAYPDKYVPKTFGLHRLKFPSRPWLMLGVTVVLCLLVAVFVDLKPQVDENFFFSSNDPQFQQDKKIDRMFPSGSQLILSVSAPDISSNGYLERLARFTEQIESIPGVTGARSLSDGPKDFADARKSPFWRRLLIAENEKASNVVVFVPTRNNERLIQELEQIAAKFDRRDFRIHIAGAPYAAALIRRSLLHDFRYFSLTAVVLFGLAMWGVFRSARLAAGMVATCTSAVLLTLLVQSMFGAKIGVLTANLATIVFVIALSHLVYMTFNWQTLSDRDESSGQDLSAEARRMTLPASFWSMVCSSLGFGSLLIVPAKPLRQLGIGGLLGTVLALICAYVMYPAFLSWVDARKTRRIAQGLGRGFWSKRFVWTSGIVIGASFALGLGLGRLNTDPSLLDYFKKHKPLRDELEYVDRNGGSNPLTIVIAAKNGEKLTTRDAYKSMWALQDALEQYKGVGTVISLPVLLAEGKRHPLAFFLSLDHLVKILDEPKHGRVGGSFITQDRRESALYLRMVERNRRKLRIQVVNDLRAIVRRHGFTPFLVGGVYQLQGELARLVESSLIKGLGWLILLFAGIAWVVARSVRGACAMMFSLCLVPLCTLGGVGLLQVPVDIISAPATNICIGMAIDSMLHLMFGLRRAKRDGKKDWDAWIAAREEQWRGIVFSDVIIAAGFGIFVLSDFPPTQRFGLVVLSGTIIDIVANLFVLPLLGGAPWSKPRVFASAGSGNAAVPAASQV